MTVRFLVAPDKFKGCLTALEVADALAAGLADGGGLVDVRPVADGGDGSVAAALAAGFEERWVAVPDALGQLHRAQLAVRGTTAVVEIANTCGIVGLEGTDSCTARLASSRGFGLAVRRAVELGARRVVLALGGSASTDGGAGMLEGLGVRLLDAGGRTLQPGGAALADLADVDLGGLGRLHDVDLVVASDVTAPLLGDGGAARVFGPQKGATPRDVVELDAALAVYADFIEAATGRSVRDHPGTGSAGGVGFAAAAVLGARVVSGAEYFLELLGVHDAILGCDVVVTGEGSLDEQTLLGKLPAVLAARAGERPVHVAVGRNALPTTAATPFASVQSVSASAGRDTSRDPAATVAALSDIGRTIAAAHRVA